MIAGTGRRLPAEIRSLQREMKQHASAYGLDCYDVIFEMVDYEEMCLLAAYGGFPTRYPHWRFGAQFDELMKGYTYGLQKIYEMVINTNPCYAYLLQNNSLTDHKLVIAHVYGHCDFFKNNAWFAPTNRRMLDQMANHATRIIRYMDRYGYETVEQFIDACLSLEDLIDRHRPLDSRSDSKRDRSASTRDEAPWEPARFPASSYMDPFVNPPEVLQRESDEREQKQKAQEDDQSFPQTPQKDVLQFLLEHAPLNDWQHDVLAIIRDEALYFAPQAQTKIMNEGWASYWHSTIMTQHGLSDADVISYADHHSGTMATSPYRLNPYKVGIELFRDIEDRWNKGRFGSDYEQCDDLQARQNWDTKAGLGRDKIFEVRRIHNDVTFIDTFLTAEFCQHHRMFSFAWNEATDHYEIASREFEKIKQQLLRSLANQGQPIVRVVNGNHENRGELLLAHDYRGTELRHDYAVDTLKNLHTIWSRPVHITTVVDNREVLLSFDGSEEVAEPIV